MGPISNIFFNGKKYDIQEHKRFQRITYYTYIYNSQTLVIIVMPSLCCYKTFIWYILRKTTPTSAILPYAYLLNLKLIRILRSQQNFFLHKTDHKLLLVSEFATQANLTSVALFKYKSLHLKANLGLEQLYIYIVQIVENLRHRYFQVKMLCYDIKTFTILCAFYKNCSQKFSMSWHIILYIIYLCDYHNAKPLLHIGAIKQERWSDTLLYNLDELYVCNSWNHKRTIVNGPKKQEAWQDFVQ